MNFMQFLHINRKRVIQLCIALSLLICYLLYCKYTPIDYLTLVLVFIDIYRDCIAWVSAFFLQIFSSSAIYLSQENILYFQSYSLELKYQTLSLFKVLYFFLILIIFPPRFKKLSIVFCLGILFFVFLNAIRTCLLISHVINDELIRIIFDALIVTSLIFFFYYKLKSSIGLQRIYIGIQQKFNDSVFSSSLKRVVWYLAISVFLGEIVLYFFSSGITYLLLFLSQKTMLLFNYTTIIDGSILRLGEKSVFVANSCLGVRLIILFAAFILFVKGTKRGKILFITFGCSLLFMVNVSRVDYILYHLYTYKNSALSLDVHDMYDYAMYILILLLWFIYIKFPNNNVKNKEVAEKKSN